MALFLGRMIDSRMIGMAIILLKNHSAYYFCEAGSLSHSGLIRRFIGVFRGELDCQTVQLFLLRRTGNTRMKFGAISDLLVLREAEEACSTLPYFYRYGNVSFVSTL
jgi:hypothetical protein